MRGARHGLRITNEKPRIIPAYAGSTVSVFFGFRFFWDHPRVCGEHTVKLEYDRGREGSSPRMRGAREVPPRNLHDGGIIPAYAGSTSRFSGVDATLKDHPRICGEHLTKPCTILSVEGSSPHMRGAPG